MAMLNNQRVHWQAFSALWQREASLVPSYTGRLADRGDEALPGQFGFGGALGLTLGTSQWCNSKAKFFLGMGRNLVPVVNIKN
jgi:hypothetical protein